MKAFLLLAVLFSVNVHSVALDPRQLRPTSRAASPTGNNPDVSECGLDAFIGHTSEALLFCSSLLKSGTATQTSTVTNRVTTTAKTTVISTIFPPSGVPSSTPRPPTSTPRPSSTPLPPSSTSVEQPPTPTQSASCGIVGYTKSTAAYYFDSSGTKNTWQACGELCKADSKCKSWGYGEANCMLFDVTAAENTNYNPMSPYTFYDKSCPEELPVKRRQIEISIGLPGGPPGISSACSCFITSGPASTTRTTTVTSNFPITSTQTVTRTVSLLPPGQ